MTLELNCGAIQGYRLSHVISLPQRYFSGLESLATLASLNYIPAGLYTEVVSGISAALGSVMAAAECRHQFVLPVPEESLSHHIATRQL